MMRPITDAERDIYRRDGVVMLRRLFDASWLEDLRAYTDEVMRHPGAMGHDLGGPDDPGRFSADILVAPPWLPPIRVRKPGRIRVGSLLGSRHPNIVFDQLLVKEPRTVEPTVWHHDLTYWPIKGSATLWLAMDDVTRATGAMEFVKGSHLWGEGATRLRLLVIRPTRLTSRRFPISTRCVMNSSLCNMNMPGDCTIHHGLLVHFAGGNTSEHLRRRAYVTRWAGDDVVYDPRPNIQRMLRAPDIAQGRHSRALYGQPWYANDTPA